MNDFQERTVGKIARLIKKPMRLIAIVIVMIVLFRSTSTFVKESEQVVIGNEESNFVDKIIEESIDSLATEEGEFTFDENAFDALASVNSDTIGFIQFESIGIREPIVQCENNEYYVKHSFSGAQSSQGAIFMDAYTSFDDDNPLIYGHNVMYDANAKFSPLAKLRNQSYYQDNNIFTLYIKEGEGDLKQYNYGVISVFEFDTATQTDEFSYAKFNFDDEHDFQRWHSTMSEYNEIESVHGDAKHGDKLLTLQTCKNFNDTTRIIIVAKQI